MSGWRDHTLVDLLATHGLADAVERPFETDGWSGASFTTLELDGRRYVLKRTSLAVDWIAGASADTDLREAWLAAAGTRWPDGVMGHPHAGPVGRADRLGPPG